MLDDALFRRFDDVIRYGRPDSEQSAALIRNRLRVFLGARPAWQKIGSTTNEVRGDFLRHFSDVQWWHSGVVSDGIQRQGKRMQERMALSWYCVRATWPIGGR